MIDEDLLNRPERRDEHGKKIRDTCRSCAKSCRVRSDDGANLFLICKPKSRRLGELVVLGEGQLAGDCERFVQRPYRDRMKRYGSALEFFESPNKKISDFVPHIHVWGDGKPSELTKFGGGQ